MDIFIDTLVKKMKSIFAEDLVCVLLLGSVQKNDTTTFSDIDLVAIIENFGVKKVLQVRNLVRNSERLIDLSFLCKDEIPSNPNLFALGTHGCYQLGLILNKAKCIYGKNILLEIEPPSEEWIKKTLVQKIIQYTWWIRRMFVESNRERSLASNYQINSRLMKMIKSMLYLAYDNDIHEETCVAVGIFIKKYLTMLSVKEKKVLEGIADKTSTTRNSANMSDEYFEIRVSLYNKILQEAMKFYI